MNLFVQIIIFCWCHYMHCLVRKTSSQNQIHLVTDLPHQGQYIKYTILHDIKKLSQHIYNFYRYLVYLFFTVFWNYKKTHMLMLHTFEKLISIFQKCYIPFLLSPSTTSTYASLHPLSECRHPLAYHVQHAYQISMTYLIIYEICPQV